MIIGDLSTGLERDSEGTPFPGHGASLRPAGHGLAGRLEGISPGGQGIFLVLLLRQGNEDRPRPGVPADPASTMGQVLASGDVSHGISDHSILILDIMHRLNESGSRSSPLFRMGKVREGASDRLMLDTNVMTPPTGHIVLSSINDI